MSLEKIYPKAINEGGTLGIISPSSKAMAQGTHSAYEYLNAKGIEVYEHPQCQESQGHTAGDRRSRAEAINELFERKDIVGIMSFWGGANTNQLLEDVDYELIKRNPKVLVGYSDLSSLNIAITHKTGLVTFMGPSVISFVKPQPFEFTWNHFREMCMVTGHNRIEINDSTEFADDLFYMNPDKTKRITKPNDGRKILQHGVAQGEVIASNLQTLLVLSGTNFFPDIKDKVLFLEEAEVANTGMVHRFLTQCRQMGMFNSAKAIVLGRFMAKTGFKDTDRLQDVLDDVFRDTSIPVIYNVDFGHTDPLITIPNGGQCYIDTFKNQIIFDRVVEG